MFSNMNFFFFFFELGLNSLCSNSLLSISNILDLEVSLRMKLGVVILCCQY
jgi:hypothetical protein